jgi:glycosyltransferase involved in cell wall biosynthesis
VLAQEHERLQLVISDNASTDGTEELCRDLAASDSRIAYHRQPYNIGLLNNFIQTIRLAKGTFFRWVGDDDWLAPRCLSRCLEVFAEDSLILVTTQINYIGPDGITFTHPYHGTALGSNDPFERFTEIVRQLKGMSIDPLYGLMRRGCVAALHRRNMIREDEVFASRLALAGPWGHVPEVLAHRHLRHERMPVLARRLGVPVWQAYFANTLQCREMLRFVLAAELTASQRRQARAAVAALYLYRHYRDMTRRGRRLMRLISLQ